VTTAARSVRSDIALLGSTGTTIINRLFVTFRESVSVADRRPKAASSLISVAPDTDSMVLSVLGPVVPTPGQALPPLAPATLALAMLGVAVLAVVGAVAVRRRRFDRDVAAAVDELRAGTAAEADPDGEDRVYTREDLADLPAPVRRYLDAVLTEGQPRARTARIEQRGEIRLGEAWKQFSGTQHVAVDPPGFVWDATVRFAPMVPVRVVDAYVDGEGSLRAKLLSALTVSAAAPAPEINESELLRYLAESVWVPTALLPGAGVEWEAIDDETARATLDDGDATASLVFHFDDWRVERVHAEARYRQEDDDVAPWTGYFDAYEAFDGVRVPAEGEVEWTLPDGDQPYWRGEIETIEYDPEPTS
jgi:hypothetical protein